MRPRTLLVEDHAIVRQAMRRLLEQDGLEVVGEACDDAEAIRSARELSADVVVFDVVRPASRWLDAARAIVRAVPLKGVIFVAFEEYLVGPAFRAGVRGYVLKTRVVEDLPLAVRTVGRGNLYLSPGLPSAAVELCRQASNDLTPA